MKRKFILSIFTALVGVASASAQSAETLVINAGNVEHVSIANDLNVILVPAEKTSSVTLDPSSFEKLDVKFTMNKLNLSSLKNSGKERTTVYLRVSNLKTLTVEDNSVVKTIGIIDSPKLDLYVGGDANVHLRSNGVIDAHSMNDAELKIKYLSDKSLVKR